MVLVNPGVAVSTPSVFRARLQGFSAIARLPPRWDSALALAKGLVPLGNDLEAPAIGLCPEIGVVLSWLRARPGCLLARMSGSGATCFGLFVYSGAAAQVASDVPRAWWGWGGAMSA